MSYLILTCWIGFSDAEKSDFNSISAVWKILTYAILDGYYCITQAHSNFISHAEDLSLGSPEEDTLAILV